MDYSEVAQLGYGFAGVLHGWQEPIKITGIAKGTDDVSRTIPGETWEYCELATFNLVTDAVTGNRYTHWYINDGQGDTIYETSASTGVAPQSSLLAYAGIGVQYQTSGSGISKVDLPGIILPSGWTIGFHIVGMDTGDALDTVIFVMRRIPSDIASGDTYHNMVNVYREAWKQLARQIPSSATASKSA